jgi:hypothetical protein
MAEMEQHKLLGQPPEDIDKAKIEALKDDMSIAFPNKRLGELSPEEQKEELDLLRKKLKEVKDKKANEQHKKISKVKEHGKQAKQDINEIEDLLRKKENIDKIGGYVAGRLRERNPLISRKIKCSISKPITHETINLISTGLVQLDDKEITFALTKGKDISDPVKLDTDISIEDLNKHVRTEKEYYDVITNSLKLFAPKSRYIDRDFINDLFQETKKLFSLNDICYVKPPKNSLFTLEGNEHYWKDPSISLYLPNTCRDRTYMFSVLNTVKKGLVDRAIEEFNKTRSEEYKKEKQTIKASSAGFGKKFTEAVKNRFTRSSARRSLTHKLSAASMEKEPKERKKRTYKDIELKDQEGKEFKFKEIKNKRKEEENQ